MICPTCSLGIHFQIDDNSQAYPFEKPEEDLAEDIAFGTCPECNELIVLKRKGPWKKDKEYSSSAFLSSVTEEEVIYPKPTARQIESDDVPEEYRQDFAEAAAVLDLSPKASAAISRRLLQQVLRDEFKIKPTDLSKEIDSFLKSVHVPSYISDQIDAVRNVGNFAAHPLKETQTGVILDVEPGEADWLLDVLESIFDFAFIQPARALEAKARLNEKLKAAGKPQMKVPVDKQDPSSKIGD